MARLSIGVLFLTVFLIPLASHAQDADKRRVAELGKMTLNQVATRDGFAYYSGNLPSFGNFPTMYAHGGNAITVVGRGFMREYPIREWRKAIQAYRALLIKNGYEVPTE